MGEVLMIFGMTILTFFHVLVSLIGIFSGFVVVFGLITARRLNGWTAVFLASTAATSVTGFLFPFHKFMPSHGLGIVSLIALAVAIFAFYGRGLAGAWRRTYVIRALLSLYLNVFVLIVQLFEKVPDLKSLAPTHSEPPFKLAQLSALALFLMLGIFAARNFDNEKIQTA
jgi:hypothetical protein